jgi:hypothetical protein
MGSCRIPARQWEGDGLGIVCVSVRSSFGECDVFVGVCVCVGFVCRWWVGVVMLWHDCEYDDV